jgi:hypothetical protein
MVTSSDLVAAADFFVMMLSALVDAEAQNAKISHAHRPLPCGASRLAIGKLIE